MKTLTIDLSKKDIKNIDLILEKVAEAIQAGFTSGLEYPVNWQLKKTAETVAERISN